MADNLAARSDRDNRVAANRYRRVCYDPAGRVHRDGSPAVHQEIDPLLGRLVCGCPAGQRQPRDA